MERCAALSLNIKIHFLFWYYLRSQFNSYCNLVLSSETKEKSERAIIWVSILSFIIHLGLIEAVDLGLIDIPFKSQLLTNHISAIYTPFSFILLFEVYLLVYHIPKSTSTYIAKQYEIITLIIIRRIFKDLANLDLSINWFEDKYDLQFTYDIISTLILFFLIYLFHQLHRKKSVNQRISDLPQKIQLFIERKKLIASLLVPVIIIMALYTFVTWSGDLFLYWNDSQRGASSFLDINNIFFDEFFTVLILTDVLLLLFSFFHTSEFHVFIRNSGFIISTILIRISFSIEGILNNALIIVSVLFGVLILWITQKYEHIEKEKLEVWCRFSHQCPKWCVTTAFLCANYFISLLIRSAFCQKLK